MTQRAGSDAKRRLRLDPLIWPNLRRYFGGTGIPERGQNGWNFCL
jgi:hypothetical protein